MRNLSKAKLCLTSVFPSKVQHSPRSFRPFYAAQRQAKSIIGRTRAILIPHEGTLYEHPHVEEFESSTTKKTASYAIIYKIFIAENGPFLGTYFTFFFYTHTLIKGGILIAVVHARSRCGKQFVSRDGKNSKND